MLPKRAYVTLTADEVPIMLAQVPADWLGFMAAGATTPGIYGHLLAEDLRESVSTVWGRAAEPETEAQSIAMAAGAEAAPLVTRGAGLPKVARRHLLQSSVFTGRKVVGATGLEPAASWSRRFRCFRNLNIINSV